MSSSNPSEELWLPVEAGTASENYKTGPDGANLAMDSDDSRELKFNQSGTLRTLATLTGTQTFTNKTLTSPTLTSPVVSGDLGVNDDVSIELGTDDDSVLRHKSATLAADTLLADVLVGTPVTDALAANSLIISNITQSGDILLAANRGGNSHGFLWIDASAGIATLTGHAGGISLGLAADQPAPDLAGEAVHIWDGSAGAIAAQTNSRLIVESDDATANYINLLSPATAEQGVLFGDAADADVGGITYDHNANRLALRTNTTAVNIPNVNGVASGAVVSAAVKFDVTQGAAAGTYTGTVEIPAGGVLLNIQVVSTVVWNHGTSTVLDVGDDDDPDGWFSQVNLLTGTELEVGEVLDISNAENWGAAQGAYLVAATGRKGRVTAGVDSGVYQGAATEVIGVITGVGTAATTGTTYMIVTWMEPTQTAAVYAAT